MNKNIIYIILLIVGLLFLMNGFIYPINLFFIIGLSCIIICGYIYVIHPPSSPTIYKLYKTPMSPTATSTSYTTPSYTVVITPQQYVSYYTVSTISPSTEILSITSSSNIITVTPSIPNDISGNHPSTYDYVTVVTASNEFGTSTATVPTTISFAVPVQPIVTFISPQPQLSSGVILLQSNYSILPSNVPIVINPPIDISGSATIQLPALPPDESFYMIELLSQSTVVPVSSIIYTYPNIDVSGNNFPISMCIGPFGQDGQYSVSITEYTLFGPSKPSQFSIMSMYSIVPNT